MWSKLMADTSGSRVLWVKGALSRLLSPSSNPRRTLKRPIPSIPLSETYPTYERAMRKNCMKSKFEQRLHYTTRLQQGETPEAIFDDLFSLLQDAEAYSDRNSYH